MNTDLLIDAIGEIDENKIINAKLFKVKTRKKSVKRMIVIAAAIILCITVTVPVLAATVNPIYELVYKISPGLAQMMKPVQMSCEDNGIKMEVISASVYENEAAVYLSLEDMTDQNRIDETTDLFDSYHINQSFDAYASCSRVSFDNTTGTATFLINITRADGKEINGNKITFSFTEFISQKNNYKGELSELDLGNAIDVKDTFTPEWFRGSSGIDLDLDDLADTKCLVPMHEGVFSPVDGVTVTNIGFIDNKLHIQVYYEDIKNYDNHGYIFLRDKFGKNAESFDLSFWDDNEIGSYDEIIYDIAPDEINNYTPFGEFITCKNKTEGFWQVTFPLEKTN